MMYLQIQLLSIVYMCILGIIFGFLYSFKQIMIYLVSKYTKFIIEIMFMFIFIIYAYIGLYKLNEGVLNKYLILCFITCCLLYYFYLYPICIVYFMWFRKKMYPLYKISHLLLINVYCIMYKERKRKRYGKKKKTTS